MDSFTSRLDLGDIQSAVFAVRTEFEKLLVGQRQMVDLMLIAMLSDGHILLEGVPGVAKTLAAKILSKTVDVQFSRIQFTPDLMPSDVLGTSVFNPKTIEFEFRKGPVFSEILLIDEINRAPAKTQSALFEVMEERQVTIDGHSYPMRSPFLVIATQNPIEQEGTYRLPEAQLDRFLFKINVDYPSFEEEVNILKGHNTRNGNNDLSAIQAVMKPDMLQSYRTLTGKVHVEEKFFHYITQIVQATRRNGDIYLGASPRATVAILKASKSNAVINGRDFITPEDVKFVTTPILRHRIILTPEKEMEGFTEDEVIQRIIDSIEVPR